ncbi:dihydrofolate reductase family protein [Lederbergia lenta]|uniref:Oxidoreductase n=1 Tax=Lederbergia lenta TaxID=1467 RepID=A0A2X4WM94_LEDLE|nr:dihydrofolate reductase family protein [Lederbergia lenta]MCM3109795.1 dihydrofolate reductase family protein [Lederbergia lenta]MEC2324455.1 dihydrofolate reductase family protein [Lederbergia lenta]SQI59822.1 oxidoreductase [Lederbergia lenta]
MSDNVRPRRIILDLAVTLDGFIEGENGEVDWCIMDAEMNFNQFLNDIDTILYGRKSYDLWGDFTPQNDANEAEKEMWETVHSKEKYVFSRTQKRTENKVTFINDNIIEEVNKLKNQNGKDIWLYGGGSLITTFIELGLVDEFRLSVHPVILGEGKRLFMDINKRINLQMVDTKKYSTGVVQLIYRLN